MEKKRLCKYCGREIKKVYLPSDSDWGAEYIYVCLNDECSYFIRGWDWMWNNYNVVASYRYMYNPVNGYEGPFPVTKENDIKFAYLERP
ncbi:MAG: ogr/Delta-like zinc finger family protein [Candidatus Kapaibacteriales bacterium]